jgi:hypothetical protein
MIGGLVMKKLRRRQKAKRTGVADTTTVSL